MALDSIFKERFLDRTFEFLDLYDDIPEFLTKTAEQWISSQPPEIFETSASLATFTPRYGQLKLFIMTYKFMKQYGHLSKSVVYPGAAPGFNISLIASLFPDHTFYLFDERPIKTKGDNCKIFKMFLNRESYELVLRRQLAEDDTHSRPLLISDIRRNKMGISLEESEEIIHQDNELQMEFFNLLNPIASTFKFRIPFYFNSTAHVEHYSFLNGTIVMQPYVSPTSNESRLFIGPEHATDGTQGPYKLWNCKHYEASCLVYNFLFRNCFLSTNSLSGRPNPDLFQDKRLDMCHDCEYLRRVFHDSPSEWISVKGEFNLGEQPAGDNSNALGLFHGDNDVASSTKGLIQQGWRRGQVNSTDEVTPLGKLNSLDEALTWADKNFLFFFRSSASHATEKRLADNVLAIQKTFGVDPEDTFLSQRLSEVVKTLYRKPFVSMESLYYRTCFDVFYSYSLGAFYHFASSSELKPYFSHRYTDEQYMLYLTLTLNILRQRAPQVAEEILKQSDIVIPIPEVGACSALGAIFHDFNHENSTRFYKLAISSLRSNLILWSPSLKPSLIEKEFSIKGVKNSIWTKAILYDLFSSHLTWPHIDNTDENQDGDFTFPPTLDEWIKFISQIDAILQSSTSSM